MSFAGPTPMPHVTRNTHILTSIESPTQKMGKARIYVIAIDWNRKNCSIKYGATIYKADNDTFNLAPHQELALSRMRKSPVILHYKRGQQSYVSTLGLVEDVVRRAMGRFGCVGKKEFEFIELDWDQINGLSLSPILKKEEEEPVPVGEPIPNFAPQEFEMKDIAAALSEIRSFVASFDNRLKIVEAKQCLMSVDVRAFLAEAKQCLVAADTRACRPESAPISRPIE